MSFPESRQQRRWKSIRANIAPAGMTLFCLCFTIQALYMFYRAHCSRAWPVQPGVITKSSSVESSGYKGSRYYIPEITYFYRVNGKEHFGNRIQFGDERDKANAEALVSRFQPGKTVDVYVNPKDPADTVLLTEVGSSEKWKFGVCAVMTCVAGFLTGYIFLLERRGF